MASKAVHIRSAYFSDIDTLLLGEGPRIEAECKDNAAIQHQHDPR